MTALGDRGRRPAIRSHKTQEAGQGRHRLARVGCPAGLGCSPDQGEDRYRRADIRDAIAPTPGDAGVRLHSYADRWDRLSPFEKSLFYWYEVHRFGLEQQDLSPPGGYHRARFEDLLKQREALTGLLDFLGLPPRPEIETAPQRKIDRFHHKTAQAIDFRTIRRHPEIIALSEELGYRGQIQASDLKALAQRYQKGRLRVLGRTLKDALSRPMGLVAPSHR